MLLVRYILWSSLLLLLGCTVRQSPENKSALHYLNGAYYDSPVSLPRTDFPESGVDRHPREVNQAPMVSSQRPANSRVLQGQVILNPGPFQLPLKFTPVALLQSGQVLFVAPTDAAGRFMFTGELRTGLYTIAIQSERYTGKRDLVLEGDVLPVVQIVASPLNASSSGTASPSDETSSTAAPASPPEEASSEAVPVQ